MKRTELTKYEMRNLFGTFVLTDEEQRSPHFDMTRFGEMMASSIDVVHDRLRAQGFAVGFRDGDDVFVNFDFWAQRIVHTELTNNATRFAIEEAMFVICGDLAPGMGIVLDVRNHERRSCERSLVCRDGIYFSDYTSDVP